MLEDVCPACADKSRVGGCPYCDGEFATEEEFYDRCVAEAEAADMQAALVRAHFDHVDSLPEWEYLYPTF